MGRNAWNLWSAGNEHFWNRVAQDSFGLLDMLKTLDNRKYKREERFKTLGLSNQPGFRAASKPRRVWLMDRRASRAGASRESTRRSMASLPASLASACSRIRSSTRRRRRKWDGDRYLSDPDLLQQQQTRPALSSRSFLRVLPHRAAPTNPPADPANPRWENLASAIGNQYFDEGKVFGPNVQKGGFFFEELQTQPRGTSDTSRIATDHINNPNAINPIFLLGERERHSGDGETGGRHARPARNESGDAGRAHPQGRRGLHRRARRHDPRLRQHRDVFRVLADATQAPHRPHCRSNRSRFRMRANTPSFGAPRRNGSETLPHSFGNCSRFACRMRPAGRS